MLAPADGLLQRSSSNIVDDEEEMLYGDSSSNTGPSKDELNRGSAAGASVSEGGYSKAEPSHWCLITRESGVMEVWGGDAAIAVVVDSLVVVWFRLSRFTSSLSGD